MAGGELVKELGCDRQVHGMGCGFESGASIFGSGLIRCILERVGELGVYDGHLSGLTAERLQLWILGQRCRSFAHFKAPLFDLAVCGINELGHDTNSISVEEGCESWQFLGPECVRLPAVIHVSEA